MHRRTMDFLLGLLVVCGCIFDLFYTTSMIFAGTLLLDLTMLVVVGILVAGCIFGFFIMIIGFPIGMQETTG